MDPLFEAGVALVTGAASGEYLPLDVKFYTLKMFMGSTEILMSLQRNWAANSTSICAAGLPEDILGRPYGRKAATNQSAAKGSSSHSSGCTPCRKYERRCASERDGG